MKKRYRLLIIFISIGLSIAFFVYNQFISINDIKNSLSSIITLLSIVFAIYGVTLSTMASLYDTKLMKKLLRKGSKSKIELKDYNRKVLHTTIITILIFILIQLLFTLLMSNIIIFTIVILISVYFLLSSLLYMILYFDKISSVLFNHTDHE
ncbi:hypothetical protein [Mammaliicoccus sciuri]|uniref:hypothetical protein n=1 Tax=Mammaliicoccus sciuri TaxID=1296 RepID=UPI001E56DAC6|nr:hypothetical protein [Mammaliicoccus sciuri]MCD8770768.1 hypothetical protein [Mammaliicoccus sciuri]UXU79128.1 hypothetical protein MUA27_05815 [Mammaliicoccus sciuri]